MRLPEKVVRLHEALDGAALPHAFGGAIALAWCTQAPRGTADVDINVFVTPERADTVLEAMPDGVSWSTDDRSLLEQDGQARIWWDRTPVDLFLNTTDFHTRVAKRVRFEPFEGAELPFLDCRDLAVFKVFFDRAQDRVDLQKMHDAGTLDIEAVAAILSEHLGPEDPRIARLRAIPSASGRG